MISKVLLALLQSKHDDDSRGDAGHGLPPSVPSGLELRVKHPIFSQHPATRTEI